MEAIKWRELVSDKGTREPSATRLVLPLSAGRATTFAQILLVAGLAVAAVTGSPGRVRAQVDVIDVARPGAVTSKRFTMHQRVHVEIRNLNPFAGTYRILVYEKSYSDSAISQFLSALGITVPAAAPQTKGLAAANVAGGSARNTLAGFSESLSRIPASGCNVDCEAARSLVRRFSAFLDTLSSLEAQDADLLARYQTVTSERADSAEVMTALGQLVEIVRGRVDTLHRRGAYLPTATGISAKADELWGKLGCDHAGADTVCMALGTVTGQKAGLALRAAWRDTLQSREERTLPTLLAAQLMAAQLFVQVMEVGDYDYPTTVDILVQRRPLVPLDLTGVTGVLTGASTAAAGPKDSAGGNAPANGGAAQPDTGFAGGWRTVANPRLSFGERRRIGLGGALVLGPETTTYAIATTDTTRVAIGRREQALMPLLTLTTRLCGFDWLGMGWALNLHLGVTPNVTTRQTYFAGIGIAFADERIGIMVGYLSLPIQNLIAPDTVGTVVKTGQTSAPTQDGRLTRLAVGVNLRPF